MTDLLNNSFEEENSEFANYIPNGQNTLFNDVLGFANINDNNLNEDEEGPTGDTLYIRHNEPRTENEPRIENEPLTENEPRTENEHGFFNQERRRGRGRGRERGESNGKVHNKYKFDNMLRKAKGMIIKVLFNFINKKIMAIYDDNIGQGNIIKKLFMINQAQVSNANIDFNKAFLEKTLGEIFSADLTKRIVNYNRDHNKILIEKLKNEKDEEKKEYFNGLFNLEFSDCLKYFRGANVNNDKYKYIKGLKKFCDLKNEANFRQKNDPDFIEHLELFINDYEYNLNKRKGRKTSENII